jgi:hypothetical protein
MQTAWKSQNPAFSSLMTGSKLKLINVKNKWIFYRKILVFYSIPELVGSTETSDSTVLDLMI